MYDEVGTLARAIIAGRLSHWVGSLGGIPARLFVVTGDILQEIWIALAVVDRDRGTSAELRDVVFAKFVEELAPCEWEWRQDWAGAARLPHYETARLFVR